MWLTVSLKSSTDWHLFTSNRLPRSVAFPMRVPKFHNIFWPVVFWGSSRAKKVGSFGWKDQREKTKGMSSLNRENGRFGKEKDYIVWI